MIIQSFFFILWLIINKIKANTEIINFRIKNNNNLKLNESISEFNQLNINEQQSLSILTNQSTIKQFYKINLNYEPIGLISTHWQRFERSLGLEAFTIRLCWPASYPTSFDLSIYSTSDSSSSSSSSHQIPMILTIKASSTGIPFPNTNSTTITPFTILLEPLYLTFLPHSSIKLIMGIILLLGLILSSGLIGKVGSYLEFIGRDEVLEAEGGRKEE